MEDDLDIQDLIAQLATNKDRIQQFQREIPDITDNNLNDFVLKSSAELVTRTLGAIDTLQTRILSAEDPGEIEAFASVLKASATAIDLLNKLHISNERNKTVREVKAMEIRGRQLMNTEDNETKVLISRDEMMKALATQATAPKSLAKEQFVDVNIDTGEIVDV